MILSTETVDSFEHMTNAEAYVEVFHNRFMRPLPESNIEGSYRGNGMREGYYGLLKETLALHSLNKEEVSILDVGAGSGEVVDDVLKNFKARISVVEPNELMVAGYLNSLNKYKNLSRGSIYRDRVEKLYSNPHLYNNWNPNLHSPWLRSLKKQDVILANHMIYGLNESTHRNHSNPVHELLLFIRAMYDKLEEGGTLFIVYADLSSSLIGQAGQYYCRKTNQQRAIDNERIWRARHSVFETGVTAQYLNDLFKEYDCELSVRRTDGYCYGDTIDDIISYCTLGELTTVDGFQFEINKLLYCSEFIEAHYEDYDLHTVENGPRKGMLVTNIPQVVCTFEKRRR